MHVMFEYVVCACHFIGMDLCAGSYRYACMSCRVYYVCNITIFYSLSICAGCQSNIIDVGCTSFKPSSAHIYRSSSLNCFQIK